MSHVEQEKRVIGENFRIGELERVEGTNRRDLKQLGRKANLARRRRDHFDLTSRNSTDEIFGLGEDTRSAGRRFFRCRSFLAVPANRRDVEHEVLAFLVQDCEPVQAQRVSKQIKRRVRLLDDSQNIRRVGDSERARFGATAEFAHELFQFARKIFRRSKFFGDGARREARENKAMIALASKRDTFEYVFTQVDADNRICPFRHDAFCSCSGKRALRRRF